MGIDRVIRARLFSHPSEWSWRGSRFLNAPGVTLVRSVTDERWTFVVGKQLGYVKLSLITHLQIEMARALKRIPDEEGSQ
tara:strand:+ start:852 stop:1091 length:240 start_codon:yes stop_codon:yes gene_type:complete